MASERAKELQAKQKAEAKAAKIAKKNSANPADWGTFKQLKETYKFTAEADRRTPWVIFGSFAAILVISTILGAVFDSVWYGLLIGVLAGFSAAGFGLSFLAKNAAYLRHKGQIGAGQVPLMMLPKKKWTYTPAISGDKNGTIVHRAVGAAGIVLVGEGNPAKVKMLLAAEAKKHQQLAYDVPVTTIVMGEEDGQIPMQKITKYITKLPKRVDKLEIASLEQRIKSIDAMRQRAPLPRGPLPNVKGTRRMMRGK